MKSARVITCPSCGAPLARGVTGRSVQCKFCDVQIELKAATHAGTAAPPQTVPKQNTAALVWVSSVGAFLMVVVIIGVGQFMGAKKPTRSAPKSATNAQPVAAAATAAAAARVSMSRLAKLDVGMKLAQAQARIPADFPEAEPDVHRKEFTFDVDDPVFRSVRLDWEWGCDCLDIVNLRVKDYPTELAAPKTLIPCLEQKLGKSDANSTPPFHYYWSKITDLGRLSYDTGVLTVSPQQRKGAQQAFRRLVETVAACSLGATKR